MGIFLGLLTAVFFAGGSVFVRVGMHGSPRNDGLYMTIFVNVLFLGAVAVVGPKPEWSTKGVVTLVVAGLVGTAWGRYANLRAIRFVGATRASVFITGTPLAAAIAGWLILDETVGLLDAAGGLLVVAGLLLLALAGLGGPRSRRCRARRASRPRRLHLRCCGPDAVWCGLRPAQARAPLLRLGGARGVHRSDRRPRRLPGDGSGPAKRRRAAQRQLPSDQLVVRPRRGVDQPWR